LTTFYHIVIDKNELKQRSHSAVKCAHICLCASCCFC